MFLSALSISSAADAARRHYSRSTVTTASDTSSQPSSSGSSASSSSLAPPAGYAASQLIFEDQFTSPTLDSSKWDGWMGDKQYGRWGNNGKLPSPYSSVGNDGGYDAEYSDPYPAAYSKNTTGNHTVTGAGLRLIASPSSYFSAYYSWASGNISSGSRLALPSSGGYVQVRAKMPDSRYGAWGGIWFLGGTYEIDLQESGTCTNCDGASLANRVLAMHVWNGQEQVIVDTGKDLSAGYHTYGMEYRPGISIKMYLDGVLQHTWTSKIATGAYEIILGLQMAQNASGWHTLANARSQPGPFEMNVSHVQIYSLN